MGNEIKQILELNLTKEEKEALLGVIANELIENKSKTWETKNEELKEKSRKQAQEVRERQEKRNNEYALNYEIKKMEDELLKITNNRGEHICTRESLNELSLGELEELYYRYFGEHKLDGIHEKYYGTDNRDQDKAQEVKMGPENNVIDSQDVPQQNNQVIPEIMEENKNDRVIVSGDLKPGNLVENDKIKNTDFNVVGKGKLLNAYPCTVEELKNNSGLEKEKNKVVTKIAYPAKSLISFIKRKKQEHLDKKQQKETERQAIESNLPGNNINFVPVQEVEYEEPEETKIYSDLARKGM